MSTGTIASRQPSNEAYAILRDCDPAVLLANWPHLFTRDFICSLFNVISKKMAKKVPSKATKASEKLVSSASASATKNKQPSSNFPQSLFSNPPKTPSPYVTLLKDFIWTVDNILSARECQDWIDYMEHYDSLEYTQHRANRYMAARECFRLQKDDPITAQCIFDRIPKSLLSMLIPNTTQPVACNPNIRLYKYCKGHSFGMHVDESNTISNGSSSGSKPMTTRITVLIYLSECQGGATRFRVSGRKEIAYAPKTGSMLLHLHGDDCLPHQGDVVQGGIKYVLRTDLVYAT